MIERDLRSYFYDSQNIQDIVGERIYVGHVPRGVTGPAIVVSFVTSEHYTHLHGEIGVRVSRIQVDCYHINAAQVSGLADAVQNRLSGYRGMAAGTFIQSATLEDRGYSEEQPDDASDKWTSRQRCDFRITHTQPTPNLT